MSTTSNNLQRQSANFDPSVWGDFFITFARHNENVNAWSGEAKILKEKVRKMLTSDFNVDQLGEKISLIDALERLGVAYHFEVEIQEILQIIFKNFNDQTNYNHNNYDLTTLALLFRILRQHGYNISCDIFNKYRDDQNGFKEDLLGKDIAGMLSLYEATHLKLHGETILEEALEFTKTTLECKVPYLKPYLGAHVTHTLKWPTQKCFPRLATIEFISFYQHHIIGESHNNDELLLLKFAKLDFNLLQLQYQEELNSISMWWKELEVKKKLGYARDRITECYFWILGVYYEPQYVLARKFSVKVIALTSLLDDTYDAYGTYQELELLTRAFQRWDISAMDELPEYMKTIYKAVLDTYSEMEEQLVKEGRSYAISYAKDAMKRQVRAYLDESKWLHTKKVPSMEEYMSVAVPSAGYPLMAVVSLVGLGEIATKKGFQWIISEPLVLQSVYRLCRLMDDIVSHELEREREHIPSAVECYMKEYNVSASEARDVLNSQVKTAWNDINEAFLDPDRPSTLVPSTLVLTIILNLTRVMELLYTGEDIYTHPEKMKPYVASLLVDPLEI